MRTSPSPARRWGCRVGAAAPSGGGRVVQTACRTRALRPARLTVIATSAPISARAARRPISAMGWFGSGLGSAGCTGALDGVRYLLPNPALQGRLEPVLVPAVPQGWTGSTSTAALPAPAGRPGPWSSGSSLVRLGGGGQELPNLALGGPAAGRPDRAGLLDGLVDLAESDGGQAGKVHRRQRGPEHQCACAFGHGYLPID